MTDKTVSFESASELLEHLGIVNHDPCRRGRYRQ